MQQAKLMVLGASSAQLPIIRTAVALGCYVITVDNVPDNIGHQFSQQSISCSTVDKMAILAFARELNIDGIVTFASDIATAAVAYVAENLNLTGCTFNVAEVMSNKASFRLFQQAQQLRYPAFFIADQFADVEQHFSTLKPPLIFKPVDTSGSRGITKVDVPNLDQYRQAFSYAQQFSRAGVVSVETFIEGVDVSGDGFLLAGELCAIVTQKYKHGFIPTGHSFPTQLSVTDQARVFAEVRQTCAALGYLNGPVDFDVKISATQVVIIEISPRLGGNGIPELIRRSTGVDLIDLTVRYALGKLETIPASMTVKQPCGSWVFGTDVAGCMTHIATEAHLKANMPELFEYVINYQIGDYVPHFEHSGNCLGYALFDCSRDIPYPQAIKCLQAAMQLQVTPI